MRKLIKLENNYDIKFDSSIKDFINPEYIYLPIDDGFDLLAFQNDKVLKGDTVLENRLKKVKSPVSGVIKGTTKLVFDGKEKNTLVIQNSYEEKEKFYTKKRLSSFSKESIINMLYEYNLDEIANIFETKQIKNLVISGMEDEPYIENNSFILKKYLKEILEITDKLQNAFEFENTYVAVKSTDTQNIDLYLNKIGMYPNISLSLIEDKYLLATPFFLLESLNLEEKDSLVLSSKDILNIYNILKNNIGVSETFITISSPFITKSKVIHVKIGSSLKEILNNNVVIKEKDIMYIYNGLMTGYEIDPKNIVITNNTKGVIIIPFLSEEEEPCNLCGMCYKICPVKVNPKKAMDAKRKSKNCIDCGLCTYICPCKINLRKYLRGQNE